MNQTLNQINDEKASLSQSKDKEAQTVKDALTSLGWVGIIVLVGIFTITMLLDLTRLRINRRVKKIMRKRKASNPFKNEEKAKEDHFDVYAKVREMDNHLQMKLKSFLEKK